MRQWKWHNGKVAYECEWKTGDVVGLACDLESMQLHVSVNGSFAAPNGVVFALDPDTVRDGLFAAFTGYQGKLRYNLGAAPFTHAAPSADYKGFVEFDADVTLKHSRWLHAASRGGDTERVLQLIQNGANIAATDQVIVWQEQLEFYDLYTFCIEHI